MIDFFIKYKRLFIGVALGAFAGFLYWHFIGCTSGTCPITSKWHNTTLYGAIVGYVIASPVKKKENNSNNGSK